MITVKEKIGYLIIALAFVTVCVMIDYWAGGF